ncbi:MAG TPA: DivIVA domain-containing protein [Actinomycetes bacterium]|jgi:cell division septum initiation protein DivIVA|nr:DivIVA domain-containing protein [Actinomycetes bacterium]
MSVFEPHDVAGSSARTEIGPPDFPVVVRGYDRQRVDAYLQRIVSRLMAERERAAQAEQAAANDQPPTFEHLGAEAMKVLDLAGQSAEVLVAQAKGRGETIVQDAEAQAADLLEQARQQADRLHAAARGTLREAADERDRILTEANEEGKQIRTLAEDDARTTLEEAQSASQRMWQTVRDECDTMLAETERLQRLRDRTMERLGQVRAELNSLFARSPEEEPDLPSAPDTAADDPEGEADAGPERAASADAAEPDSAPAVQPGSDPAGGSEVPGAARASSRSRQQPARSG